MATCLLLCSLLSGASPIPRASASQIALEDHFEGSQLDATTWTRTARHDCSVDVVDVFHGQLRLGLATRGTDDTTVKVHGVRTVRPVVDLASGAIVSFSLDWNKQANGCYMAAGAYVCPTQSPAPQYEDDWLRLMYVGDPPGRNARCMISIRQYGRERYLLTEEWPRRREGRLIGRQVVKLAMEAGRLVVSENGTTILDSDLPDLHSPHSYLYLQQSSHSNYPLREVFFDDVAVWVLADGVTEP